MKRSELPDDIQSLVKLKIDKNRRSLIESNHTSTHLLTSSIEKHTR
jgi:alanyl-tRNA synthetase